MSVSKEPLTCCRNLRRNFTLLCSFVCLFVCLFFGKWAEIAVRIRLLNEETKKYSKRREKEILDKFGDIRSESTLELRNHLHQV